MIVGIVIHIRVHIWPMNPKHFFFLYTNILSQLKTYDKTDKSSRFFTFLALKTAKVLWKNRRKHYRTKTCFFEMDYRRMFPLKALDLSENLFLIWFPLDLLVLPIFSKMKVVTYPNFTSCHKSLTRKGNKIHYIHPLGEKH